MTVHGPYAHLADIPLFAGIDEDGEELLLAGAARRQAPAGRVLAWEGEPLDAFHVLLAGRARAVLQRHDGGEILLRYLFPGDFFGELGLCGRRESPDTVIALDSCAFLVVSLAALDRLVHRDGTLALALLGAAGRQMKQAHMRIRTLSSERGRRRVLGLLHELALAFGVPRQDGVFIPQRIPHQMLADNAGLARETVTRLMGGLQRQGLVERRVDGLFLAKRLFDDAFRPARSGLSRRDGGT